MQTLVTVNLVVLNGGKYISRFLDCLKQQTYGQANIEVQIWDNGSSDGTLEHVQSRKAEFGDFKRFAWFKGEKNLGMWPGQEEIFKTSNGAYIVASAVDVLMDKDFISNAIKSLEQDPKIGALQAKIYTYSIDSLSGILPNPSEKIIDTCGFKIFKSRRVVNLGHGEIDHGQYDKQMDIFAVEGAIPVFRKSTLKDISLGQGFCDPDYFWYGDDLDFGWRINLFGWRQIMDPSVIAWHDRQTTKTVAQGVRDHLSRVGTRRKIPLKKRQLDWANVRFTIIKNEYMINVLKDLPYILGREIAVFGYTLFFEPGVFRAISRFLNLLPRMLKRRREIMKRARRTAAEMRRWYA